MFLPEEVNIFEDNNIRVHRYTGPGYRRKRNESHLCTVYIIRFAGRNTERDHIT